MNITMEQMLGNMQLLFNSLTAWIGDIVSMFFSNPVTFILFGIPIVTFLILTVISILKALLR